MAINLNDIMAEDFQIVVEEYVERNKNLLDTMSKYQTAAGRLNRAITKAATQCGCISLSGKKREGQAKTNVSGKLCKNCREAIEKEMGDVLFYQAAMCNALGLSIYDVMLKEKQTLFALGDYSLK